ncbi:MAG: phage portal protein [Lachnobacterium sp.]|nr:phage portal protein [Lachnobacterium sp.]
MEWFSKLFKRQPKDSKFAPTFNGLTPIFSQYGTDIYASDVVQQALKCIVDEMKKLNITHVRYMETDPTPVKSNIQDLLDNPNDLMTTTEFIEKCTWLLLMNYNVFIVPTYYTWQDDKTGAEKRYYEGLYPLNPSQVDFIEDSSNTLYVKFTFWNGENTTLKYDDVIHVKYNYSINEYMGGNELGQADRRGLLDTLSLNDTLLKGIAKSMKASYSVNGIVKYNSLLDGGKTEVALKELEEKLNNSESGFLPLDIKSEFTPIQKKAEIVDEKILKFIDEKILRTWGIPLSILTGSYDKETYESFYQKALKPIIVSFAQAFTKKLFTKRERAFGNRISIYAEELIFMTTEQKVKLVDLLSPTGTLFENEKRAIFGFPPLEELNGKRLMSLNWIDVANASEYQVGRQEKDINVDIVDEEKQDM